MSNTSSDERVVKHIYHRACWVRHLNAGLGQPYHPCSRYSVVTHSLHSIRKTLYLHQAVPRLARGEYYGLAEYLFSQPPVLTGRPTSDIKRRREQLGSHDPWVFAPIVRLVGPQGYGGIQASPNPNKPTPLGQIRQEPVRARRRESQRFDSICDNEWTGKATVESSQQLTVLF